MTTEVHIRKSHSHLTHICRIVSCIGAGLGMTRKNIKDVERAVSEICLNSMDMIKPQEGNLTIKFSTQETYMEVEIADPSMGFNANYSNGWFNDCGHSHIIESLSQLADSVEFIRGDGDATVKIIKYVQKLEKAPVLASPCLATAGTTGFKS